MRSYKEIFSVPFNYDNATFLFTKNNSMSLLAETSSENSNKEHTPLTTTINHGLQPEEKHTYVSGKVLKQRYGISTATLRRWAENGTLRCIRPNAIGKRFFSVRDFERIFSIGESNACATGDGDPRRGQADALNPKKKIVYARVSSAHQKSSLQFQVEQLTKQYPYYQVVTDIGSGINWHRKGFQAILDAALQGDLAEVVVTHRDRLCRFAIELVEHIFKQCKVKFVVLRANDNDDETVAEQSHAGGFNELAEDLLAINTVFTAQYYGKRSAEARRKRKRDAAEAEKKGEEVEKNQSASEETEKRPLKRSRTASKA